MDIRELRTFMCVAQLRSFTKAASQLHIAQPALSRQIQKLEEELETKLFERHARGVQLTDAGLMLQRKTEVLFRDLHEMRSEIKGANEISKGHLTIALPPVAGSIFLPSFLSAMRVAAPHVSLHFMEGVSSTLQGWVLNQQVDLAILHNAPPLPTLKAYPLIREHMYVVGPMDGVLTGETCRLHDLHGLPLILPAHPHFNRLLIEQAAVQYGLRLNMAFEVDGIDLTRELVANGFGYGFMTKAAALQSAHSLRTRTARLVAPQLSSELALVHVAHAQLTPMHTQAINILKNTIVDLAANGDWAGADAVRF